jgi:restriction endonuclease S subunit
MKIPIPPIERQHEIVKYLEHNETLIKQLENDIELNKKLAKQYLSTMLNTTIEVETSEDNNTEHVDDEA